MKSKSLKRRFIEFELSMILKTFPYNNTDMEVISILPLTALIDRIVKYEKVDTNLAQNTNLHFNAIAADIVQATMVLETLVKHCKKKVFVEKDRYVIKLQRVATYAFFSNETGDIVDVSNYVKRIEESMSFLLDYFLSNRTKQGTVEVAICKTIYLHMESLHTFLKELSHVFLGRQIQ